MSCDDTLRSGNESIASAAASWVLRQDRGLNAAEQDELSQWLAADPRHRAIFAEHSRGWADLDRLVGLQSSLRAVPDPDLLAPHQTEMSRRVIRFAPILLAAAAAIALGIFMRPPSRPASQPVASRHSSVTTIEERVLSDGSVVQLNRGSVFSVEFTPGERRVRLSRGEGSFVVAKNPLRPFIVIAHGVEVQAVGTVFNVRLATAAVEVVVTEGKVKVDHPDEHSASGMSAAVPLLVAGDRAVVPLSPVVPTPAVEKLSAAQMAEELAWQPRLLDFADAPLADIAAEFNRHNSVKLVLDDPALGAMRLSASFRSDNVEGFVRLMKSDFGIRADRRRDAKIRLWR